MSESEIDAVLLSVGSDLPYFTGYRAMATERPTMLVVTPHRDPVLFIPTLEVPRVSPGQFEVAPWGETDDPLSLIASAVGTPARVAIGDHTRAAFLVGLQARLSQVEWVSASVITKALRMRKEDAEIAALRVAAEAVDRVVARIPTVLRFSGETELAISRRIGAMTVEEGHRSAEFAIVASGPNGASPHHEPGDRVVAEGDMVVIDFGGVLDGYFSDTTRTFVVGEPSNRQTEVHDVVLRASRAARDAVAPGVSCADVDRAARDVIDEAGFGEFFIHRTGHGIGLEVHEHPYIVEDNYLVLEPGMSFSVEPGIYLPGEFGVRIEDIVICDESGVDSLNRSDRSLVVVA